MASMFFYEEINERRLAMNTENTILLKLTDFLQKENLISAEERNRAVALIEQEGI